MATIDEQGNIHDKAGRFDGHLRSEPEGALGTLERPTFTGYASVQEKVDAMRAELADAVDRLSEDEEWNRFLDTMGKFHRYSFQNQVLIMIQRPGATRVAGFQTWKSLGRSVLKGEKGIAILAPKTVTAKDADGNVDVDANGKPLKKVVGFTSATVFDISQTEGEPLPEGYHSFSEEPPPGFADDLESAIAAQGYTISYEELSGGKQGYTTMDAPHRVVIDSTLEPGERARTLAHELGHIMCGHTSKDETRSYSTDHGGKRGEMEVEAESFAYVLCRMNGMEAHQRTASEYVAGWQKFEPDAIRAAGERLSKAFKRTVELPWRNAQD